MESLFIKFWKIDPYDWFCGPGSHIMKKYLKQIPVNRCIFSSVFVSVRYCMDAYLRVLADILVIC